MKILMLADVFYPDTVGGAGRMIYNLSLELSRNGHDIHIITRNTDDKLPSYEQFNANLFVHRFYIPPKESLSLVLSEIKNSYLTAKNLLHNLSFDFICIHQSMAAIGPLLLHRLRQLPVIYYYYSPWHEEYIIKNQARSMRFNMRIDLIAAIMRLIENRMLAKASKTIIMSQFMINRVLDIHNYPENKIVKIPGGVELDHFSLPEYGKYQTKQTAKLPEHKTIFLTVRNLVPRMGLENLIKAFHQSNTLKRKSIMLIGGRGSLGDHLKNRVEKLSLNKVVRFLGRIPEKDLPKTYQAADFFVLPTEKLEGFGLVIAESMACGTPVLGTPVGAIPELLGAFDKRLLFKGSSSEDLKKLMEEVVNKPEEYSYSRESCRKFAEDNFSWNRVAALFEEAIQNLA